jgi:hypothetical protein
MLHLMGFSNCITTREDFWIEETFKTTFEVFLVSLTCKKKERKKVSYVQI